MRLPLTLLGSKSSSKWLLKERKENNRGIKWGMYSEIQMFSVLRLKFSTTAKIVSKFPSTKSPKLPFSSAWNPGGLTNVDLDSQELRTSTDLRRKAEVESPASTRSIHFNTSRVSGELCSPDACHPRCR